MNIAEHAENMRLLRLIREEPAWALSRVQRAAELERKVEALTHAARGTSSAGGVYCKLCNGFDAQAWEDLVHSCPLGERP